jgi:hypothetical protein
MTEVIEKGLLHFSVAEGINALVRQAYWYENRQEWAMATLDCFEGINMEQKIAVLHGDATLIPDGDYMRLDTTPDFKFKRELQKHLKWQKSIHVYVGRKAISKDVYDLYFQYLRKMWIWEGRKQYRFAEIVQRMMNDLHTRMFEQAGFKVRDKHIETNVPDYIAKGRESFEEAFQNQVKAKIDKWNATESLFLKSEIDPDKLPESLLAPDDLKRAVNLHNEIVLICYGENPRSELDYKEATIQVYDEIVALVTKYKGLVTERSYAMQLLEKKNLNRRMVEDCMDWQTLDFVRATIHSFLGLDDSHGVTWKNKTKEEA